MMNKIRSLADPIRTRASRMAGPTKLLIISAVIGLVVGLVAVGFRSLIVWCNGIFFPYHPEQLFLIGRWWKYLACLIPAVGGLLVGVVMLLAKLDEKGITGVPEVIEAVLLKGGKLNLKMGFKGLLSVVTIGSGGSAGPEGPIVEIGSSLASYLGQQLRLSGRELRLLAGCGAAAGIAAVFGAPLGGIFFSLEIILNEFAIHTFAPVVLSSVVAAVVSRSLLGDQPAFQVTVGTIGSLSDLLPYALLGLLAGTASVAFINILQRSQAYFSRWRAPQWIKPAAGGLMVGLTGLLFPQILGEGYHAVTAAIGGNIIWWFALLLVVMKILSTSVTIGSGAPGGSFAPAIFIGAMLGSAFCQLLTLLLPTVFAYKASYALAGAAGLVAGALNAPITAALIIFEISGSYKIVLPGMIVVAISALVTYRTRGTSIYTMALSNAGLSQNHLRRFSHLSSQVCRDVMRPDVQVIQSNTLIKDILSFMSNTSQSILPVVNGDNRILGIVSWSSLRYYLDHSPMNDPLIAYDIMTQIPAVEADDPLTRAMLILMDENLEAVPVVKDGRLVGIIGRRELLKKAEQNP
jgi:chloride channel protein, CIC family